MRHERLLALARNALVPGSGQGALEALAAAIVPEIADGCEIELFGNPLPLDAAPWPPLRRSAREAAPIFVLHDSPTARDPVREADRTAEAGRVSKRSGSEEESALLRRLGAGSLIAVPLLDGNRVIGALSAVMASSERAFGEREVALFGRMVRCLRGEDMPRRAPEAGWIAHGESLTLLARRLAATPPAAERATCEFKGLVDHAPDMIMRFDRELRCVYANRALERAGLDPESFVSETVRHLPVDPDDAERLEGAVRQAVERGRTSTIECLLHLSDRAAGFFECHVAPEPASGEGSAAAFAVLRDVTTQKFREGRFRYQATLLDAVGDAVAAVNLEGRIVYWNRQAETLHEWKSEEVLGWHALKLLIPEDRRREVATRLRTVARGGTWSGELQLQRKDGTFLPAFLTVSPVWDEEGKMIGIVSAWTDLTERNLLEEQLRQAQKMEAVGRLAGGIAHDFNNLLTTMTGYTELALSSLEPSAPERSFVQEVHDATERATRLTRQLLAFSRKQVLQPMVVDPRQIILGMEKLLRRVIGEDLEFVLVTEEETAAVVADPTQIEQVILNLALNARDAMPLGGTLTVSVESRMLDQPLDADPARLPPGRYLEISVRDTGAGIPPEVQPHIFDPFYTTKPQGKGTGLGLSTVYGIVQQSGGGIVLKSNPGIGTTFSVYLPEVDRAPASEPLTRSLVDLDVRQTHRTILLVEDDESVRHLVTKLLVRLGYEVLQASEGVEAIELFRQDPDSIDLVLTDLVMPRKGGVELALEVMEHRPFMPVLFMSGYRDDIPDDQNIVNPGTNLLQKPFTLEQLARTVEAALGAVTPH